MPIGSSSVPGLINQPARAKAGTDVPAPNALLTERGDLLIGSDGQILTADSTNPQGVTWALPGGTVLTTKGDLYGYSTSPSRVPVGSDGQVLIADAAQVLGVRWGKNIQLTVDEVLANEGQGVLGINTWGNLATQGPQITIPIAGNYLVGWGCAPQSNAVNVVMGMGLAKNGADPPVSGNPDDALSLGFRAPVANVWWGVSKWRVITGLAANDVYKARYFYNNTASVAWGGRWLVAIGPF